MARYPYGVTVRYAESRIDAVERTAGGLLKVNAFPTRTGIFTYKRADGTEVRELRHPDEVFHPDSLASLEDVPVVMGRHPAGGVHPSDFAKLAAGHVRAGSVAKHDDGQRVRAGIVLGRQDAIDGAERKTHPELSCGYNCAIDPTPGTYEGQRYDQAQVRIRYNHVVMLRAGEGRMGRECRLDSAGEQIPEDTEDDMKITINGKTYESEAEIQAEVTKLAKRADAADAKVTELTATVARYDAEAATVKRNELVSKVRTVLGKDFAVTRKDAAGAEIPLTDRELRVAVIKRADAKYDDKDHDDVYVAARFDATLATSSKAGAVIEALNSHRPEARGDAADDPNGPRAQHEARIADAKKRGVSV